jgi:hypothetical protein
LMCNTPTGGLPLLSSGPFPPRTSHKQPQAVLHIALAVKLSVLLCFLLSLLCGCRCSWRCQPSATSTSPCLTPCPSRSSLRKRDVQPRRSGPASCQSWQLRGRQTCMRTCQQQQVAASAQETRKLWSQQVLLMTLRQPPPVQLLQGAALGPTTQQKALRLAWGPAAAPAAPLSTASAVDRTPPLDAVDGAAKFLSDSSAW